MNLKNQHLGYPVLSDDSDDYGSKKFKVEWEDKVLNDKSGWEFNGTITLEEDTLKSLLIQKKAKYHLVVECKRTNYRKSEAIDPLKKDFKFIVKNKEVRKQVTIKLFIIAFEKFTLLSDNFADDYKEQLKLEKSPGFSVGKGYVLADTEGWHFDIENSADKKNQANSFVKIRPQPAGENEEATTFKFEDNTFLVIYLTNNDFKIWQRNGNNSKYRSTWWCTLILPLLQLTLFEMTHDDKKQLHKEKMWYKSIQTQFEKMNIDISELDEEAIPGIIQKLTNYPISKLLSDIEKTSKNYDD